MLKKVFVPLCCFWILAQSCSIRTIPKDYTGNARDEDPEVLAVFMDGTNNKANSDPLRNTHIKTLHGLVNDRVRSLYIEGVGTRFKPLGSLLGLGTKARITRSYYFLSRHYNAGDTICMLGFSRGANQCRILSNLIYTAGIANLERLKSASAKKRIIRTIYRKYRGNHPLAERRARVAAYLDGWNSRHPDQMIRYDTTGKVRIELMALFETVEAFDIFDRREVIVPRRDHLNQAMNVKKLIHAVSLDDNRAWTYTPVLVSDSRVAVPVDADKNRLIEEVWFSGSHRDVGGANKRDPELQNVSLAWMWKRLEPYRLFRDTTIEQDIYAPAHNMNGTFWLRMAFADNNRNIHHYFKGMRTTYFDKQLVVHRSVIDRLAAGVLPEFKTTRGRKDWFDLPPFSSCFESKGKARILKPDCACIEVVD